VEPKNRLEELVFKILKESEALITDTHVVLTSGRHGNAYINKDAIYVHPENVMFLCTQLAQGFFECPEKASVVAAPALGGIILSQMTAFKMTYFELISRPPMAVYAEKQADGSFAFRRGYDKLLKGTSVAVVEDILTTGGSVKKTIEAVSACGGNVIAVGALVNRGGITAEDLDVPHLFSLANVELETWAEEECPLCQQGVPINTEVGKGAEYLARKAAEK